MCGIVGYLGKETNPQIGLEALKRLEYRGYDSAGMAVFNFEKKQIYSLKSVGNISNLERKLSASNLSGNPFIMHTRWATTGKVSEANAHPHSDCKGNIWVAHNGIIENYQELKEELIKEGHRFVSETDTEVLPHLIEKYFKGNLEEAVRKALREVKGAYALVIISREDPCKIVAARLSSPLLIGINGNEYLIASDPAAIVSYTKKIITLGDHEIATITPEKFFIFKERVPQEIELEVEEIQKGRYPHFMLKEIMEQPESLRRSQQGRILLEEGRGLLKSIKMLNTSYLLEEKIIIPSL